MKTETETKTKTADLQKPRKVELSEKQPREAQDLQVRSGLRAGGVWLCQHNQGVRTRRV